MLFSVVCAFVCWDCGAELMADQWVLVVMVSFIWQSQLSALTKEMEKSRDMVNSLTEQLDSLHQQHDTLQSDYVRYEDSRCPELCIDACQCRWRWSH